MASSFDVHGMLAGVNVVGMLPLAFSAVTRGAFAVSTLLLAAAIGGSMAMHLTATKHGVDPGAEARRWSATCLAVDRVAAVVCLFYFFMLWVDVGMPPAAAGALLLGGAARWLGEKTHSPPIYFGLHIVWHLAACAATTIVLVTPYLSRT